MNNDPDFTDTPAYPLGVGETGDCVSPEPRPVEWWGNARTGFSEPMVVIYNRRGHLNEVVHKKQTPSPSFPVEWLTVALLLISLALVVGWRVWG